MLIVDSGMNIAERKEQLKKSIGLLIASFEDDTAEKIVSLSIDTRTRIIGSCPGHHLEVSTSEDES